MTQLIEMIQIWFLSNKSTPYPLRQCPESFRQPPGTSQTPHKSQTPYRRPTDTPQFWPIRGNWEKRNTLIKMSLIGCLLIACISHPPRHYPESLRQPPDTSHTPSRHPTDILKHMIEVTSGPKLPLLDFYQLISHYTPCHPIPPQTISKVTQTT